MEIRLINGKSQTDSAVRLMRETFMHSVAPLYAPRGVDNFLAFIEDRTLVQSLELFGAFENEVRIDLPDDLPVEAEQFLKALRLHLELLKQDYPENLRLTDTEV